MRRTPGPNGPMAAAMLALALLGAVSLLLTWRNIRAQREATYAHMQLAAQSILRGVDAGLMRNLGRFLRFGGDPKDFPPLLRELFQEVVGADDVLFVALYDSRGQLWLSSHKADDEGPAKTLPPEALTSLNETGVWRSECSVDGKPAYLAGMMSMLGGPPEMRGRMRRMHRPKVIDGPQYLVMALDPKAHLALFQSYRRAALIQTGFVLLAGMALWSLAYAYLRRRDAAHRVEELERFQSKLLDHTPDGLLTLSADGAILAANPSASRILGQGEDIPGRQLAELLPAAIPCPNSPAAAEGRIWREVENAGRHLELLCVPLDPDDPVGERLLLLRDRTAVKGLEQELAEAQRLASIGSLAAGVAHEIRNPLGSLRGFAQLFASRLKDQPPLGEYAATMVQEADRLNRVVTDLLYLARPRELKPQTVDLADIVGSITRLMHFDLEHAGARLDMDLDAPAVYADPDGLTQVLLNLTANALAALDENGGVIAIGSRAVGDNVVIEVRDDGAGMAPEVAEKAFEPFFTGRDKGTGLGLAIVKSIVTALRGKIRLDTAPGKGTTVVMRLPAGPGPDSAMEAKESERG